MGGCLDAQERGGNPQGLLLPPTARGAARRGHLVKLAWRWHFRERCPRAGH